jgi:flagellar basal body-associated protein FliL
MEEYMEVSMDKRTKKKKIAFKVIIIILLIIVILGAVIITRYVKAKRTPPTAEFMIRVKGTIKQYFSGENKVIYLKGDNGLYYVLIGDKLLDLSNNLNKEAIVFGNIMMPKVIDAKTYKLTIEENPIRMVINVENFELI